MYSVVITAAGSGKRAGLGFNKMLFEINGMTVLEKIVNLFVSNQLINDIIVTYSEKDKLVYEQILNKYNVNLIIGGDERMDSVASGVSNAINDLVLVHDGARVFLKDELITRLDKAPKDWDGIALALASTDTTLVVKQGEIKSVLNRDELFTMQTPQIVKKDIYLKCYQNALQDKLLFNDEVSLLAHYHFKCKIVESEAYNIKLTRPEDFKE